METTQTRSSVRTVLPWIVAGAMLLIYLVTLDKVVTVQSAWPLVRANGTDWHATFTSPLAYLVTFPIRWLPSGIQLFALNFIAALCAAVSLGLLARSVSILPHDRTHLQRDKDIDENAFLNIRLAWVPVLFAVAVCGFQRSFWEHAVINTGEMLDLLLFAYCLRCLLEFRIDERNVWLYRLALVYGLGITNNFAMIAFFPVLLVVLLWIKGLRFFRFDFLVRMFLLGLAGLSLYLLLPLTQTNSDLSFWNGLKSNMVWQKHMIFDNRKVGLFPAIYTLLPLLLMGIRWPSSFGDQSPMGSVFSSAAAIVLHAGFMAFWIYIAFDLKDAPSPRDIGAPYRETGLNYVFLPCYYLGALLVGYYTGFLLLVFSQATRRARRTVLPAFLNLPVAVLVCLTGLFTAGKLLYDNFPKIQHTTSHALRDYAEAQIKSLPDKPCVILSDDATRLHAVSTLLGRAGIEKHVLLHATSLNDPVYHRFLHKRYGERVPELKLIPPHFAFPAHQLVQFIADLSTKYEIVYLHPSFGPYFEEYYQEPHDLVYTLKPYPTNMIEAPAPNAALIAQQTKYWDSIASGFLKDLKSELAELPDERRQRYEFPAAFVGEFCARALDHWGVELQRAGEYGQALPVFKEAVALDPDNLSAIVNRDANVAWTRDKKRITELSTDSLEKLKIYQGMEFLLGTCGPVDEVSFLTEFSSIFARASQYRQAEQMILRALTYAPGDSTLLVSLANIYLMAEQPDQALALLPSIRTAIGADASQQIEVARLKAWAEYEKDDFPSAVKTLQETIRAHPDLDGGYDALAQLYGLYAEKLSKASTNVYAANVELTNALKVVDTQLATQPKNPSAFFMRGKLCVLMGDFDEAITAFSKVLELQKDTPGALLNRAIAKLQSKKYDEAKVDYEDYLKRFAPNYRVYYGLGEIAYQQKNWAAAREYYKNYSIYAPLNSAEAQAIRERLQELKKK